MIDFNIVIFIWTIIVSFTLGLMVGDKKGFLEGFKKGRETIEE